MDAMPISPNEPLTITLQRIEWNLVMAALNEAPLPLRLSRPVVDKVTQQLENRSRGNGRDEAFPGMQENYPRRPVQGA